MDTVARPPAPATRRFSGTGRVPTPSRARVARVMTTLDTMVDEYGLPVVEKIAEESRADPFKVLVSTMLSARTQDATTDAASRRLLARARSPRSLRRLTVGEIENLIYPVSFYRHKARHVKETCRLLDVRFGGRVPATMEELLTLPGVGRKTANLVMIVAHQSPDNICVDTHVHRIANRLGWVRTRTPEETEQALYRAIERRWWSRINLYLVTWGQRVCRPIGPKCSVCAIRTLCPRVGVTKSA
jgi:endonuclease-3